MCFLKEKQLMTEGVERFSEHVLGGGILLCFVLQQ